MKGLLRIVLLGVIVILGFTVVFPEWFDFKDQVIAEKHQEQLSRDQAEQVKLGTKRHQETEQRLRALEPEVSVFAERIWRLVDAGNYQAPFEQATQRLRSHVTQVDSTRIREIYDAMGAELSAEVAQSKPGFDREKLSRVYLQTGMNALIAESNRWSDNALLKRTLELKLEQDQLKVDALLLEVFLYPDHPTAVPQQIMRPHVFR